MCLQLAATLYVHAPHNLPRRGGGADPDFKSKEAALADGAVPTGAIPILPGGKAVTEVVRKNKRCLRVASAGRARLYFILPEGGADAIGGWIEALTTLAPPPNAAELRRTTLGARPASICIATSGDSGDDADELEARDGIDEAGARARWVDHALASHPDGRRLYDGEPPGSYAAVATCFKALCGRYAESGGAEQSAIKDALRRMGAHLALFAQGGAPGADISIDELFHRVKAAADAGMKSMTKGQHDEAVRLGLARRLDMPRDARKSSMLGLLAAEPGGVRQDAYLGYITPQHTKKVLLPMVAAERFAQVDPDECLAVAMLFHGEYVDAALRHELAETLRGEPGLAGVAQSLLAALNKDFMRVLVKLLNDYAEKDNPHASLLDIVRRSASGPLEEQERFVARLTELGPKALRKFVKVRAKETLTDPEADVKFVNVCLAYTPTEQLEPGGREAALTYAGMVSDPRFAAMADEVQKRNPDITDVHREVAIALLGGDGIARTPITMIVEIQMYLPEFLENKKKLHGLYKFGRPSNLVDLAKDLAKFATNPGMAHVAEAGGLNEPARLRVLRDFRKKLGRWLPLPSRSGELDLDDSERLQAAIKKRGAAETLGTLVRYCDAVGVTSLG